MLESVRTVKMRFHEDKYLDRELVFPKDTVVDVKYSSMDFWLLRGGQLLNEADYGAYSNEVEEQDDSTSDEAESADRQKRKYTRRQG